MYCRNCGEIIDNQSDVCPNCGSATGNKFAAKPGKSKLTEFLLCLFLGAFGAHRFYMRKYGTGILYLFTAGCFGIGWLVDAIRLGIGIFSKGSTKKEKSISAACIACVLLLGACGNGQSNVPDPAPTETMQIVTEAMEETTRPTTEPTTVPTKTVPATTEVIGTTAPETEPTETEAPTTEEVVTEPETEPVETEPAEEMVWIPTGGGKKYHSRSGCSNMDNPQNVPLSKAIARGFTPCKRCY